MRVDVLKNRFPHYRFVLHTAVKGLYTIYPIFDVISPFCVVQNQRMGHIRDFNAIQASK